MIHTTALDMHPPLFYLLLRAFGVIFGTDVFTLKLMSVLVTGCSMMLGLTLIRKNWGAKVAFLYILIVGLGPQFIFNAVNIRMYELVLFFVTGSALFAYEIIQKRGKKQWLFFVLCSLGGVYTHYFAVVPLILIYGYLLIGLFWERRDDLKSFWFCCIGTIVGYAPWIYLFVTDRMKGVDALIGHLPWLTVVLKSFQQESNGENINFSKINLGELLTETFDTNIKYSVEMIIVLFIVAIVLFILNRKAFTRKEKLFLFMCAINMILSYIIIGLLASTNTHFITGRYVFAALGLIWLFMIVIVVRCGRVAVCAFVLNLTIYVLSAYTVHKSTELGTNTYLNDAYRVLEQVQQEEIIMYNFPTYHILYGVHLPEQDFVWIYDMDWENFEQDYIYFICWGGKWLTKEIQEKHQLEVINCGTMRFEEGLANVQLYKINILNHK